MTSLEIFIFILLALGFAAILAQRTKIPSPIMFVITGLILACIPAFNKFQIPPNIILPLFLPPLLMEAAYFTSLRDFKAHIKPILQLAIGFVIGTCLISAAVIHAIVPDMEWAAAFTLGAIISPPDAIAATSIAKQVRLPRRVKTVLEGESLVNDATGLVLYKFAVMAAVISSFSLAQASITFVWMVVAGLALGFGLGWIYMRLFRYIREPSVEILSSFLIPYAAYFIAEEIQASGVLAVVAAGLTVGWLSPICYSPSFRMNAEAVWRSATFVLNGLVFIIIGLYFPSLVTRLAAYNVSDLIIWSLYLTLTLIIIRFAWVFGIAHATKFAAKRAGKPDPYPNWQNVFIVAWTGMRGVVSLATALALPLTIAYGTDFPDRDLIIFLTFSVILLTLALQGLSLPWVVKKIGVAYEWKVLYEDWTARKAAAESALETLKEIGQSEHNAHAIERIASHYQDRIFSLGDGPNTPLFSKEPPNASNHPLIQEEHEIWQNVLNAERNAVVQLRQNFTIGDDTKNDILRDLDLMHNRYRTS